MQITRSPRSFRKSVLVFAAAAAMLVAPVMSGAASHGEAPRSIATAKPVDIVAALREASAGRLMQMPPATAIEHMDNMLVQQYGAKQGIVQESDPVLRDLYEQAATLLMNGYPIAGGTYVAVARNLPQFGHSEVGKPFVDFVDAMLSPTDDDHDDLAAYAKRAALAREQLRILPADLQLAGQVYAIGAIYDDDIARQAGLLILDRAKLPDALRAQLAKAAAE